MLTPAPLSTMDFVVALPFLVIVTMVLDSLAERIWNHFAGPEQARIDE